MISWPAKLHDHVVDVDTRLGSRGARHDADDQCAGRRREAVGGPFGGRHRHHVDAYERLRRPDRPALAEPGQQVSVTLSMGMAKPMFCAGAFPDELVAAAVFIPMTCTGTVDERPTGVPGVDRRLGLQETVEGLGARAVRIAGCWMDLPSAEMMPSVTDGVLCDSANALPIASTSSPT